MGPAGSIAITVVVADGRIGDVRIVRPGHGMPNQLLSGLPPEDVERLVPRLYPVCGSAHAVACGRALEAALARPASPRLEAARDALALSEAVVSHVWQLGLAWPEAIASPPKPAAVRKALHAFDAFRAAVFAGPNVLRPEPAWSVAESAARELGKTALALAAGDCPLVDAVAGTEAAGFAGLLGLLMARRERAGQDVERLGLVTASIADSEARADPAAAVHPGEGTGSAMTARGVLNYRVRAEEHVVHDIQVDAPTDRTFPPGSSTGGPLFDLLLGERETTTLARDAGWVVLALDPCLPWSLEVTHA